MSTITDLAAVELTFLQPVPGLEAYGDYSLRAVDDSGVLFAMHAVAEPRVRLLLTSPTLFFPQYAPAIGADVLASLELESGESPALFAVVHPGQGDEPATVNLLAPIVVGPSSRRAVQVVLTGTDLPLRAPLGDPEAN